MIIYPPYDPIDECIKKLARVIVLIIAIASILWLLSSCTEQKEFYPRKDYPDQVIREKSRKIMIYYDYGIYQVYIQKKCFYGWKFSDTLIFNHFKYEK